MRSISSYRVAGAASRAAAGALSLLLVLGGSFGCASAPDGGPGVSDARMSAARAHVDATQRENQGVHRWPAGSELVVAVRDLSRRDSAVVFRAFATWLSDPGVSLRVRPAVDGESPDVVFRLVDRIEEGRDPTGLTRIEWVGLSLVGARVELARYARCGDGIEVEERDRAILHEVGHVLGLGPSERRGSIMHRHAATSRVDDTDRAALTFLYTLPMAPARSTAVASGRDP